MIGGKMIGHRPISTSQHHPGAQRRQLRTGAIEAEQGQRGHGGRKPGKGMNLATSPQNECENRRRRPSRGLAHTPGTPIFALFRWTSERAAWDDLQSDINCLPERSLLGAFGKQHDDYDHDVFNSAGSTLATPHFGPENGVHLTPPLSLPLRKSLLLLCSLLLCLLGSLLLCLLGSLLLSFFLRHISHLLPSWIRAILRPDEDV